VNFYQNGANSCGAFKHPGTLSEEAFNRLKKELKKNYTGLKNTGTPMILEDGLEFQQFSININMPAIPNGDIYLQPLNLCGQVK
jgi:phage portal protein BeeE